MRQLSHSLHYLDTSLRWTHSRYRQFLRVKQKSNLFVAKHGSFKHGSLGFQGVQQIQCWKRDCTFGKHWEVSIVFWYVEGQSKLQALKHDSFKTFAETPDASYLNPHACRPPFMVDVLGFPGSGWDCS